METTLSASDKISHWSLVKIGGKGSKSVILLCIFAIAIGISTTNLFLLIVNKIDLIEEIGRIYGFNKFVSYLPESKQLGTVSKEEAIIARLRPILINEGFNEIINYSFKPQKQDAEMQIINPLGLEFANLMPNILKGIKMNKVVANSGGPGSSITLDPEIVFMRDRYLKALEGKPFDEMNLLIQKQLEMGVLSLSTEQIKKVTLAYEPVWAIGTGVTANPDQIQEIHQFIRNLIHQTFDETISNSIRILYGGSVKPTNAEEIFNLPDVDGGLIGGASLKFADFQSIVEAADV